jgi:hypothetical protein
VTTGTDDQLMIELDVTRTITYDLVHNRRPVIHKLRLTPPHGHQLTDLFVRVTLQDRDVDLSDLGTRDPRAVQRWRRAPPGVGVEAGGDD